jgi:zinc transporter 1/2/3
MLDFLGGRQRIASVKRQMNSLPVALVSADTTGAQPAPAASPTQTPAEQSKDVPRVDPMLSAMATGCCDSDAVFRAEQGWQVMLLEAGIIFHS